MAFVRVTVLAHSLMAACTLDNGLVGCATAKVNSLTRKETSMMVAGKRMKCTAMER